MQARSTALPDVVVIEPTVFSDDRGWFMETFNEARLHAALRELGLPVPRAFVQDNQSYSRRGVLRGLHYQLPPHPQGKLVRAVRGRIFDVAVDLRSGSPTFGRWVGEELSAANRRQMWVPEGFAHGFLALDDDNEVIYKTTDFYSRECEQAIRWDAPDVGIEWPLEGLTPIIAPKDAAAGLLSEAKPF